MSGDPLAWVRAEMDAAEKVALAAQAETGPRWRSYYKQVLAPDSKYGEDPADANTAEAATHIARHGPDAVLRRIAADRKLLELHPQMTYRSKASEGALRSMYGPHWEARLSRLDDRYCETCHIEDGVISPDPQGRPCDTVRLIAESWGWTEETT